MGAGCVRTWVVPGVVCCQVAFSRAHFVDPSCDKLPKPCEGVRAGPGRIGVVWEGQSSGPVSQEVLFH